MNLSLRGYAPYARYDREPGESKIFYSARRAWLWYGDAITYLADEVPVIGPVVAFPFMLLFLLAYAVGVLVVVAVVIGIPSAIFWTAPAILWLSVFHGVSVVDSFFYALSIANGQPQYEHAWGLSSDPNMYALLIFNLVVWATLLVISWMLFQFASAVFRAVRATNLR